MVKKRVSLNPKQLRAIEELIYLASWGAASSLSQMLQSEAKVEFSGLEFLTPKNLFKHVGPPEEEAVVVVLRISGSMEGSLLFLTTQASAEEFIKRVMHKDAVNWTELEVSAIQSLANILGSSFLNSINRLTGLEVYPSPPVFLKDMTGAIFQSVILEQAAKSEFILFIKVKITTVDNKTSGSIFIFPTADSFKKLIKSLKSHG